MTAYIGYNNILETGTVTVTSETTGYEKENAYDWLPHDWWQAAASGTVYLTVDMGANTTVDYWALAFHDLHDHAGTIKPQYSTGATSPFSWSDLDTVQTPSTGIAIFRPVTSVNVRYYRFEITSTGSPLTASYIGALSLGQALQLQRPIKSPVTLPIHGRKNKILNNTSENGKFIGRSVESNGYEFDIAQNNVTPAWMDANYINLISHVETKPFFYLPDYESRPTEAMFAWVDGKSKPPRYNNNNLVDFAFKCMGLTQ